MQTKAEFIDEHWDEILEIDSKMRHAANVAIKEFFDEESDVPSLLERNYFDRCDAPIDLFVWLAERYSMLALGNRVLNARTMIEVQFQLSILQASIGDECVLVVVNSETPKLTIPVALRGNKVEGEERHDVGLALLRLHFSLAKSLPASYQQLLDDRNRAKWKAVSLLWTKFRVPKQTSEEKEKMRYEESERIQREIVKLCKAWHLDPLGEVDVESWILQQWSEEAT